MDGILGLILVFAPLILVLWAANLAETNRLRDEPYAWLAWLAYGGLGLIYGLLVLVGFGLQGTAFVIERNPQILDQLAGLPIDLAVIDHVVANPALGIALWGPSLLGILLLTPPLRRFCAWLLSLDAASPVHAVALSMTMLIAVNLLVTLGIGLGVLAEILDAGEESAAGAGDVIALLWSQQMLMALMSMIGVGWLSRRSLGQVLQRLGLVRPSGADVLIGVGAAVVMVPISAVVQAIAMQLGVGVDPGVEQLTEQLIGDLFRSPWGILTLGMAAAIGEEPLFRGALQPRFGLILTSILFAVVHGNYGLSPSTVLVLILGLTLGLLRIRRNTTTAVIAHAGYNMIIGLMAFLAMTYMEF